MDDPTRWEHYVNYFPVEIKNERELHILSSRQVLALDENIRTGAEKWEKDLRCAEGSYLDTCFEHIEALADLAVLVGPLYDCAQKEVESESACEFLRQTGGKKTNGTARAPLLSTVQREILSYLYGTRVISEAIAVYKKEIESASEVLWLTGGENTNCTVRIPLPSGVQTRILSLLYGDAVIETVLEPAIALYKEQLQVYKKLMIIRTVNALNEIKSAFDLLSQKEVGKTGVTVDNTTLPPNVLSRISSFYYKNVTDLPAGHKTLLPM